MYNFKSFKNTHVIDELNGHINVIIGPNGSGKSNIIDSILFVLGYRAKKMRHTILKNLITKSSKDCYVELVFNKFVLKRELEVKSGNNCHSRYKINGDEISNIEFIDFVRKEGIDIDNNRFLILQGEIESISMLGPLELLRYIEDCIGTSVYEKKINEITAEINNKKIESDTLNNTYKFIETDFLYKKGKIDEKILLLRNKKNILENKMKVITVKNELARRRGSGFDNEKESTLEELNKVRKKQSEISNEIIRLENEKKKLNIKDKEDEIIWIQEEIKRIENANNKNALLKKKLIKEISELETKICEFKKKRTLWENEYKVNNKEKNKNEEKIKNLREEIEILRKRLYSYEEVCKAEESKKKYELELVELLKKKDIFIRIENEISVYEKQREELLKKCENGANISKSEIEKKENELRVLENDINLTKKEIDKRNSQSEDYRYIEEQYKRENAVYKAIKDIPGVYGPAKMLGEVEGGYETALECATKGLSNIVVETTELAERCIEVININKMNRTSFIILNKIEDEGIIGENYLCKRIRTESKFVKVFWHLLRDTIVCDSIEEARRIAFGSVRRRVVTKDGKLFERSGIMSGGKIPKKVKGTSELKDILEKMKALYDSNMKEIREMWNKRNNYIKQMNNKEKICEINEKITILKRKREMKDKNASFKNLKELSNFIEKVKEEIEKYNFKNLSEEIQNIMLEINNKGITIEELDKKNRSITLKIREEPVMNLEHAYNELSILKNRNDEFVDNIIDCSELKKKEKDYTELYERVKGVSKEINERKKTLDINAHDEAILNNKLEEIEEGVNECKRIIISCKEKIERINREYVAITKLLKNGSNGDPENEANKFNVLDYENEFNEMGDDEIRIKSKELIKRVNEDESENMYDYGIEDIGVYKAIFLEYEECLSKYNDIKKKRKEMNDLIKTLNAELQSIKDRRFEEFMEGFNLINKYIKEIFSLLTFGGNAELDLINFLDLFNEGITYNIMPCKKSWKQVSNLSGGEKTLSSLSLIFALHRYKPSSFYVMDEIDAALDYKNVNIIAQYITRVNAQFLIISLRDSMFETINTLIGVYKNNEVSEAIVVDISQLVTK